MLELKDTRYNNVKHINKYKYGYVKYNYYNNIYYRCNNSIQITYN